LEEQVVTQGLVDRHSGVWRRGGADVESPKLYCGGRGGGRGERAWRDNLLVNLHVSGVWRRGGADVIPPKL
jgi:hypothetical protein